MSAQRRASRTAYHGIGRAAARRLLSADYGRVLAGISANPVAMITSKGSVVRYRDDHTAVVRTPRGLEVESSTAPLRVDTGSGQKRPVDLNLVRTPDAIEPRNPVQGIVIGEHLDEGVALTGSGISLTMLGSDAPASMVDGKEAFYSDVARDADATVTPKLNGADLSALLRSIYSPEELRYRVGIPLGAKLVAAGGGAVIRRGDEILGRIPPPWARDAQGAAVPVSTQVNGDELRLVVAHRERSFAYPVFVDPELMKEETLNTSAGWVSANDELAYSEEPGYFWWCGCGGEYPRFPELGASFSDSGTGGVSIGAATLPFVHEFPEKYYRPVYAQAVELWNRELWMPGFHHEVRRVYFDGVTAAGAAGPHAYSDFRLSTCFKSQEWSAPAVPPPTVVFEWECSRFVGGSDVWDLWEPDVEVTTGTDLLWNTEPNPPYHLEEGAPASTGPASLSVAAIVVAWPLSWEGEGFEPPDGESYGAGNPAQLENTDCMSGDPVNCATGNLTETQQDLAVGGSGPGLNATRTYNSQLAATEEESGSFGPGWTGNYEGEIEIQERCIANCEEISTSSLMGEEGGGEEEESEEEAGGGPVAAYSFDEGEGETAADSAGEHDGSVAGAEWTPGKFGPALRFPGNHGGKVTVPSSTELELTQAFTLEAWVRPGSFKSFVPIVTKETPSFFGYALELLGSRVPAGYISPEGYAEESVSGVEAIPVHSWSHLALTFDGEEMRLYVDGTLVGSAAASPPQGGAGSLQIGGTEVFNSGFAGKIDEVRIYDRALDAEEIQADEGTPIGTTEGSEGPEEEEPEEEEPEEEGGEILEEAATVRQYNGSTTEFRRINGEPSWTPVNSMNRAELVSEEGGFVYTLPDQTVLRFNPSRRLSSEEDANGNAVTIDRDAEGRVSAVSDESGRELVYSYNSEGLVESIEDPMGHVVHYGYEVGNLVSVSQVDSTEPKWQFTYDHNHELTSVTDGRGEVTRTKYKAIRAVEQEDPMGRVTSWAYATGEAGSTTTITEPNGTETVEEFNEDGLVAKITKAAGSGLAATTTFDYNAQDELIAVTDPDERTVEFGYDAEGNKVSETDPAGDERQWVYDGAHHVVSITNPNGETTMVTRDARGNPESISRLAPGEEAQTTTYAYGPHGELESTTDPLVNTWTFEYDAYGNKTAETDPEGEERSWSYDTDSQMISSVPPRGNEEGAEASEFTTTIERDTQGRPIKVIDPLGGTTEYAYDQNGDLESEVDANGHKTTFTYDAVGEPTAVEQANGDIFRTGYDDAGRVTSQTNGNEETTTYVRNALEETVEIVDPLERTTRLEYDPAGLLVGRIDPDERKTTYAYDAAGRLHKVSYSDGTTPAAELSYDEDGNLVAMSDGTGESSFSYDQLDRLTEAKDGQGDLVTYKYNVGNEQTGIVYPNGKGILRGFDKAGRLTSITDWLGGTTTFGYDRDSEITTISFPEGTADVDKYSYDRAGRMSGVDMRKGSETLALLSYSRDELGQIGSVASSGLPGAKEESFAYDKNNRLTSAGAVGYGYDAANRLAQSASAEYTYDGAGELEKSDSASFTYNEEGERTELIPNEGSATSYEYDQAGRLIGVQRPGEGETPPISESYTYNGLGLRASQSVSGNASSLTWDMSAGLKSILSDGQHSFIYGPDGLPFEQISLEEVPSYLHHDQLGSTRLLTDSSGEKSSTFSYGAYGVSAGSTGTETTPLRYAGQYTDAQSGLQYLHARMYDPVTGQFLTVDPVGAATRAPYAYVGNNPMNGSDPAGLCNANPLSGSFWTEGNCLSESPFNPIPYYQREVEAWQEGCSYWSSVLHGLKGAATLGADTSILGAGAEAAGILGESGPEIDEANADHIFRDAPGHLAEDTAENRAILEDAVRPGNYVETRPPGVAVFRENLPNGEQVWVEVYKGRITNGGVNRTPR